MPGNEIEQDAHTMGMDSVNQISQFKFGSIILADCKIIGDIIPLAAKLSLIDGLQPDGVDAQRPNFRDGSYSLF